MAQVIMITPAGDIGEQVAIDLATQKKVMVTQAGWADLLSEEPVGTWIQPTASVYLSQSDEYETYITDKTGTALQPLTRSQASLTPPSSDWRVMSDSTGYYIIRQSRISFITAAGAYGYSTPITEVTGTLLGSALHSTYIAMVWYDGINNLHSSMYSRTDGSFISTVTFDLTTLVGFTLHDGRPVQEHYTVTGGKIVVFGAGNPAVDAILVDTSGSNIAVTRYTGTATSNQFTIFKGYGGMVSVGADYYVTTYNTGINNFDIPVVHKLTAVGTTLSDVSITGAAYSDIDAVGVRTGTVTPLPGSPVFYYTTYASNSTSALTTAQLYSIDASTGVCSNVMSLNYSGYGNVSLNGYVIDVPMYSITGNVTVSGSPVQTELTISPPTSNKHFLTETSDVNGDYEFRFLQPGDKIVTCRNPSGQWASHTVTPVLVV